ncbi:methionine synthase [Inmirania thermothiophila]|uniref:Methionine synthase n=1 Tax=Inmirania thermothiophila TaxID=1750597 RepID=A0A3N1Y6R9_9GAMM|nr:methionine synthase [Inmirania thermothiophila]ROR34450.1 methionine synthase (B12-dependent) [Inmirania thermothiophila]
MAREPLLERLRRRVLLADGGTGTFIQGRAWDVERDFLGHENCSEILNRTRPDFVAGLHRAYLEAGADCIETNTFGANHVVLGEFGLAGETRALNREAAAIARAEADRLSTPDWPRYVLGSMGPGTRLPSLGQIDYDALEASYREQALGLVEGGVDALLLETHQDLLTVKAAINGARAARVELGREAVPILVSVTVEATGTLLVGSDIGAALVSIAAMGVDGIGLNCATGPAEMAEHVRFLCARWPGPVSVMPNAGLPILVEGETRYPLTPEELALWQGRFVEEDGVNLIGGCCGTTPEHIARLRAMLDARSDPAPRPRRVEPEPAVASLYTAVPLRQENAVFAIGERCNANGSKRFRELLAAEDWDGLVGIAREQEREGSHALDVCVAYVGRDEARDMAELVSRLRAQVTVPLVLDSTDPAVLETALKLLGGKSVINSINFEDGEDRPAEILRLARRFGAAVIALTIDEAGMAKSVEDKLRIAERLHAFAVDRHGLPEEDLFFDPLTFTICTGMEDDREHAVHTLEAIERLAERFPRCQILLGLSNVSFGLRPAARHVLNSVFLHHAQQRGMTAAIIHVSKIAPLHRIPEALREAAEDLIFNRWRDGADPLGRFIALFEEAQEEEQAQRAAPASVEERLRRRIVDGDRRGLEDDLEEALQRHDPVQIINEILLDGMREVGELFGAGRMQLPFVLQSAETMKAAVRYLEPRMPRVEGAQKGTLVLATVKGDVHDIGKNLVDIILTNNGYKVVNLGIKKPIQEIIEAAERHRADAVGMSGLLVKSTVIMKENLEEMRRRGLDIPVLLGGAALTRRYVEEDCRRAYTRPDRVHYAKDAFAGLRLMERICAERRAEG